MKSEKGLQLLILSLWMLLIPGCVDDKYGLDNLPDNLVIAGDSLILPLGKTDSLFMKKFLADQNFEYLDNRNGIYFLVHKDSAKLTLPSAEDLKIADFNNAVKVNIKIEGTPSGILVPITSTTTFQSVDSMVHPIKTGEVVKRLDYAEFKQGNGYARMSVKLNLQGTEIISGGGFVTLKLEIPDGLVVIPDEGQMTNNIYQFSVNDINQLPIVKYFTVKNLTSRDEKDLIIRFISAITLNEGSIIKYTGENPSLKITLETNNLMANYIKGQIDYTNSASGIKADISEIYSLFKNNSDIISLYNPALYFTSLSDIGIPLDLSVNFQAIKNQSTVKSDTIPLDITGANQTTPVQTNKFAICNFTPPGLPNGVIWTQLDLNEYVKWKPDILSTDITYKTKKGTGSRENPHFISASSFANVNYQLDLPLSFAEDFQLSYSDTLKEIFNHDINKYLFQSGEVKITGNIITNIPLNAEVSLAILSENTNENPIQIKSVKIIKANNLGQPATTPFLFTVTVDELKTMNNPRHLKIAMKLTSNSEIKGTPVKESNFIYIEKLRIIKSEGITVKE